MDDVQTRWRQIRGQSGKTDEKDEEDISTTLAKPQRHVSFTDPLVTGGDVRVFFPVSPPIYPGQRIEVTGAFSIQTNNDDDDDRDPPGDRDRDRDTRIKKIYYIDEDFSLEEVVLLHNIAVKWERDRWLAISTRFNDLTQRAITPEQAYSIVEES